MLKKTREDVIGLMDEMIERAHEKGDTENVWIYEGMKKREEFKFKFAFNAVLTFCALSDLKDSTVAGARRVVSRLRDK